MSTLREAAEKAIAKHDDWAAQMPAGAFDDPPSDAIDALRAELAKPDARPAPAEPQGAEAPQEIKSLRDRIIEGELELDGTHPPTLMFLMAEHWKAVATEHYAKAKDYDRLKHELRLSRTAPAPRPAGGERERYEFVLAQCREAQDIAASRGWALNDIATASTTDPRARKIATEALLSAPPQPAAQQEQAIEHCLWARNGHARCPQQGRKPLTEGQIECHGLDTPERVCFYEQDFYVLSNFSSFSLIWQGFRFDTSEAAYHWEKFPKSPEIQDAIRFAPSAHEAFKVAERYKAVRRDDWDQVKAPLMKAILIQKALQHEYVRRKLLATGDRELVENSWRDDFWGWGPNQDGQNMLGKLWTEVRAELRGITAPKGER